jgi:hypothetical protein
MGDVYGGAKQNIVWLGESDDSTAATIEVMNFLWLDILIATDNLRTFSEVTSTMEASHYSENNKYCRYELQPLVFFFSNTWFERLWCVQEVALAPTNILLCGRFELSLLRVLRVAVWCAHKLRFLTTLLEPAENFRISFYFKNQRLLANLVDTEFGTLGRARARGLKPVFAHLLEFSTGYQATIAADRVFALLGLIRGFDPSRDDKLDTTTSALLMPDY